MSRILPLAFAATLTAAVHGQDSEDASLVPSGDVTTIDTRAGRPEPLPQGVLDRPDGLAPAGVLQDHLHPAGEWMLFYRLTRTNLEGNRSGLERVSKAEIVDPAGLGYQVAPTEQSVERHVLGGMYGITDTVTFFAAVPFLEQDLDSVQQGGGTFTTESSGLGDVELAALVKVHEDDVSRTILNLGFTAPTGSIDESDRTPFSGPGEIILPYQMQLGSGTWDLRPGITLTGQEAEWSWGAQAMGTVRLGRNDRDYSLGDRLDITTWAAYRATDAVSISGRLALGRVNNIDGADEDLDPTFDPAADPTLRAGTRIDALVGVNARVGRGNRLAIEAGWPISQDLEGPQLEVDFLGSIGWQISF